MQMVLSREDGEVFKYAQRQERGVRNWRRYQAILLARSGTRTPAEVAEAVGCRVSRCPAGVASGKRGGHTGLHEDHHGGHTWGVGRSSSASWRRCSPPIRTSAGNKATEWTVPLLATHLSQAGYAVSEHTLRRTLHRLGWRWKRPRVTGSTPSGL